MVQKDIRRRVTRSTQYAGHVFMLRSHRNYRESLQCHKLLEKKKRKTVPEWFLAPKTVIENQTLRFLQCYRAC